MYADRRGTSPVAVRTGRASGAREGVTIRININFRLSCESMSARNGIGDFYKARKYML